jgi:hypothetical protein
MTQVLRSVLLTVSLLVISGSSAPSHAAEVKAQLIANSARPSVRKSERLPSSVIWLEPFQPVAPPAPGKFALLQKNKMFTPHLLVVPVGSSVAFPNADPFFHNVFSLFDGKRFDLGLYEAGSTRSVLFSRVGVSYIFCNIHSEMSAVVIALDTPFYGIADPHGSFRIQDVPDGDYNLQIWVEGQAQKSLDEQTRRVHISGAVAELGDIRANAANQQHLNKFGRPYEPDAEPPY